MSSGASSPFLAIVNPRSGGGRKVAFAREQLSRLRDGGLLLACEETRAPGDATAIARRAYHAGTRNFVAVGGDGTAYELLNGLFPEALEGPRAALGFVPLGTGNSFVRDFDTEAPARALCRGVARPCDIVRLTHDEGACFWLNQMAVGFAAEVCALTNRRFKAFGPLAYGLGVCTAVAALSPQRFAAAYDNGEIWDGRATLIAFCNSRHTGGGMLMAPDAHTDDGEIDVVTVGPVGRLELLQTFPRIFTGTHVHHPAVSVHRSSRVQFHMTEAIDMMLDGEILTGTPGSLRVHAGALDIYV